MRIGMHYNQEFVTAIMSRYKEQGKQWLDQLPHLIDTCAQKWELTDIQPFPEQTYNYIAFAKQSNQDVVLKLRIDTFLFELEVAYLRYYQEPECVRLLDYDTVLGAMLLERIMPGTPLTELMKDGHDHQATTAAMHLLQKIQKPAQALNFPDLDTILPRFDRHFPELECFTQKARALREKLLATSKNNVLLHGDFHHGNILADRDGTWRVIDPEGLIGDRAYDAAVFIRNPLSEIIQRADASHLIKQRITTCARMLNEDYQHIYEWTYLQTVTSAYWSAEDGLSTHRHVQFLEILETLNS